ncbi:MAG: hypothetical protein WDM81_21960 [Rhizomicrobium sp.]
MAKKVREAGTDAVERLRDAACARRGSAWNCAACCSTGAIAT